MNVAKDDARMFAAKMNLPLAPNSLTGAVAVAERFLLFHSFSVSDDASRALASATFIFGGNREAWEVYRTVQDVWAVRRFGS
jgi:hypothetical protein